MNRKWRTFWARLFSSSRGWSRKEKVLEYVAHRIDDGAPLQEVVQEEYVRRMATKEVIERILSDPRILEGVRERVRQDLRFEGMATRRTSRVGRSDTTPKIGHGPGDRTNRRRSTTGTSDRRHEA